MYPYIPPTDTTVAWVVALIVAPLAAVGLVHLISMVAA